MEDSLEQFIKLTRNTKEGQKTETNTFQFSKQEIITAQRKAECHSKAIKIVQFLIEGKLKAEVFLRCLKHINQSFYQDVVEERAIVKMCGYPLCDKRIPEMPAKQFFIDMKRNKVYDITERKNFCSNFCYSASLQIKLQIDESPLWLRNPQESPNYNLLSSNERGSPGEEVDQGIAKPQQEPSFTSISSFAEISLEDISNGEIKKKNKVKQDLLQTVEEETELVNPEPTPKLAPKRQINKPKISKKKKDYKKIFDTIKTYIKEWVTLETYIFLYGAEKLKCRIHENHFQQQLEELKVAELTLTQQRKYLDICRKLQINKLLEDSFDKSVLGFKIKPIPDYKQLKEENHNLDIKVHSFYSGDTYQVNSVKESKDKIDQQNENECSEIPAVVPLADVNSQNALRRKIYLNSISKAAVALAQGLQLPSYHVTEELNALVKTFKLQAHNVVFEPFLWSLIALILIKMSSIRDEKLKVQLDSKQSKAFIDAMLKQLPGGDNFFKELFDTIEDIDQFLQQYFVKDNLICK